MAALIGTPLWALVLVLGMFTLAVLTGRNPTRWSIIGIALVFLSQLSNSIAAHW